MATLLFGQLRRSLSPPFSPKIYLHRLSRLSSVTNFLRRVVVYGAHVRYARVALKNHTIIQHDCRRRYLFARLLASVHEEARETARIIRTRNTGGSEKLITGPPPTHYPFPSSCSSLFFMTPHRVVANACTRVPQREEETLDGEGAREERTKGEGWRERERESRLSRWYFQFHRAWVNEARGLEKLGRPSP